MRELSKSEMKSIKGGGMSATAWAVIAGVISFISGFNVFVDMGRALGSSIRRLVNNNMCDF